jgi:hypothetical protein
MDQRPARAGRSLVCQEGRCAIDKNVPGGVEIIDAEYAPRDGDESYDDAPAPFDDRPFFQRILSTEPALVRGFVTAALILLTSFGAPIDVDQKIAVNAFIAALFALAQAWSTRQSVSPVDKVAEIEDEADEAIALAYEAGVTDAQLSGAAPGRNVGVA